MVIRRHLGMATLNAVLATWKTWHPSWRPSWRAQLNLWHQAIWSGPQERPILADRRVHVRVHTPRVATTVRRACIPAVLVLEQNRRGHCGHRLALHAKGTVRLRPTEDVLL